MIELSLLAALLLPAALRWLGYRGTLVIVLPALLYPVALWFHCKVVPGAGGDPGFCMWYGVAMLFSPFYSGAAATIGYSIAAYLRRKSDS